MTCGAFASASYELMFATDNNGDKINRYDAITGASLGSFGQGFSFSYSRMSLDPSTSTIFVGDINEQRILKFNYSTGEFMGHIPTPGRTTYQCLRLADGSFVVGGESPTFSRYSAQGVKLNDLIFSDSVYGVTQAANGQIYGCSGSGKILRISPTGGASSLVTTLPNYQSGFLIGIKAQGNTLAVTNYADDVRTTVFDVLGNGNFGSILGSIAMGTGDANNLRAREVAFGHNGLTYTLVEDATAGKNYVYSYHYATDKVIRKLDLGINGGGFGCFGLSTVVAPEPGTMLALGAGLITLARKRRSRA